MINNREFKFNISISREGYKDKNEATKCLTQTSAKTIKKEVIAFKEEQVTVDELIDKAVNGYAFCYLYNIEPDKKYFKKTIARLKFFAHSLYIKEVRIKVTSKSDSKTKTYSRVHRLYL